MRQNLILKKKWLKKIPIGFNFQKQNNTGVFFKRSLMRHTIINWNLVWFYLQYQLNLFKQISMLTQNLLLITDDNSINSVIAIAAKKINISYVCGNWRGGALTKIEIKENIPDFIINFGAKYSQNLYNEIAILLIPSINFFTNEKSFIKGGILYNIPFSKINSEISYYLSIYFIWFIKKNKKYKFYENCQLKGVVDPNYINQLQLINFKIQIYKQWTNKYFYKKGKNLQKKIKKKETFVNNLKFLRNCKTLYFPLFLTKFFFKNAFFVLQQEENVGKNITYQNKSFVLKNLVFDFKNWIWKKK